jgi:uncharacterized protein DUF6941
MTTAQEKPLPIAKVILLCDRIERDEQTGATSIVNIFDAIFFDPDSGETPSFTGFVWMTDGIGRYALHSEINSLDSDSTIFKTDPMEIEFDPRPNQSICTVPVPPLRFPSEGAYDFIVFLDGREVAKWKFYVWRQP